MTDTATIVRLAARGDGVTADGRFVLGAAIGDIVSFTAEGPQISAGPRHQTPACRHFGDCGGCQLQHVISADYQQFVVDRILRPLAGVGIVPGSVMPVAMAMPQSRRRAALRAVKRGGRLLLGFNAESSHRIVDIIDCRVLRPELLALVAPLRALLRAALVEGQGAGVTLTGSDTGIDLLLANIAAERLAEIERLTDFAARYDLARLSIEGAQGVETIVEARPPQLSMGGVLVTLPPAPFLQATREGEAALVAAVSEAVGEAAMIADLFCGLGTFALPLSARARVMAADAAGNAVAALTAAARGAGRPVVTRHRDLFRQPLTPAELSPFDALVFDPPRAGAEMQARALAASTLASIVGVSCNPNTFARDAAILAAGGYRLQSLWPVAQFHWSTHVELVGLFQR